MSVSPTSLGAAVAGIVLLSAGCTGSDDSTRLQAEARDSAGVRIVASSSPLSGDAARLEAYVDSLPLLRMGTEAGPSEVEFHDVSRGILLSDSRFVIANRGSGQLRMFDSLGAFIRSAGSLGAGPGEFQSGSSMQLFRNGGALLASDNGVFRVHDFDTELSFLRTRALELSEAAPRPFLRGVFADKSWLVLVFRDGGALGGAPGSLLPASMTLWRYDSTGRAMQPLGEFAGASRFVNSVEGVTHYPDLPLSPDLLFAATDSFLVTMRSDAPELVYRDLRGGPVRISRWARPRQRTSEIWPAYKAWLLKGLKGASLRNRKLYGAYYQRDLPLSEFAPLYSALVVDESGNIWLQRFRLPNSNPQIDEWDVIAPGGEWLGVARTPGGLRVLDISATRLLARSRDSLGVERVEVFRVHRESN